MTDAKANLPMTLTLARMGAGPVVAGLVLWAGANAHLDRPLAGGLYVCAAALFTLAALSDWLDGHLARKYGVETALGAALDHAADKVLVSSALLALAYAALPLALTAAAVVIVARDLAVAGLREGLSARGQSLPVSMAGKIKAVAEMIAVTALLAVQGAALLNAPETAFFMMSWLAGGALWTAALLALWSGLDYAASAVGQAPQSDQSPD